MPERQLRDIRQARLERAALVSIGVFDGLHRGHQRVIDSLVTRARATGQLAAVLTFFPHPDKLLSDIAPRYYLTSPKRRADRLLNLGVDVVITQRFDDEMRNLPAEDFVQLLVRHLRLQELWVGADFALGYQRRGDIPFLRQQGAQHGFTVKAVELISLEAGGRLIRSSNIREYIRRGELPAANAMLGYPFAIDGIVARGEQRGRKIGVPTANLDVWAEQLIPAAGVYATWALVDGKMHMAATNIGYRPTFAGEALSLSIEAHLLDFAGDIYGKRLELRFEQRLRAEQKFDDFQELVAQIRRDIAAARALLNARAAG